MSNSLYLESLKRPATVRPSEGTTSDSDSSDISDHSEFTTVRRRKASKASERNLKHHTSRRPPMGLLLRESRNTVDEVKEDLLSQNLPVQSVRRLLNRYREPLDLFWSPAQPRPMTRRLKPPSSKLGAYALSGVKAEQPRKRAYPGSVITASPTGIRPATVQRVALCLGDHGTAQCTRNKDTDSACVLCKQKATANYPGCPRAPKSPTAREGCAAPCARGAVWPRCYCRAAAGPRNAPPAAKIPQFAADDLSQLMSVITVIDTGELTILEIPHRREPDGKIN
ncbi:hypothetical protein EVAR_101302_1, partial [Eumeta japonica]